MGNLVTNEHFVPEPGATLQDYLARGARTAVHHLIRYEWAEAALRQLGAGELLLDVACGAGYGSHALARAFPGTRVVGGDYDEDAVDFARTTYGAANLEFTRADVTRWEGTLDQQFDRVVCFDTIEHVGHREIMMQGVVEHLAPDGMLLLSTPVRSQNILNPGWEHHKLEYSRWALYDFLRRYFEEILAPDLGTLPCVDVFDAINTGDPPIYALKMNPLVCRGPIRVSRPPLRKR